LNCEIGGFDWYVITTKYITHVHCNLYTYVTRLFCNALVDVIYSGVSGQCTHTVPYFNTQLLCMLLCYLRYAYTTVMY